MLCPSWVEHGEPTGCQKPTAEQLPLLYTCKAVLSEIVKVKALWCGRFSFKHFCLRPGVAEVISSTGEISGCCSLMWGWLAAPRAAVQCPADVQRAFAAQYTQEGTLLFPCPGNDTQVHLAML